MKKNKKYTLAIIEKAYAPYRLPLFKRLSELPFIQKTFYYFSSQKGINLQPSPDFLPHPLFSWRLKIKLKERLFLVYFNPGLLFRLLKDRPEIIICEGASNLLNNLSVLIYARLAKTPYLWMGLGRVEAQPESFARKIFNPLIRLMLNHANAILAYSTFAKEYYHKTYQVPLHKIFVFYNSVDTDAVFKNIKQFKKQAQELKEKWSLNEKKVILFVGRFIKQKKIENLILAFREIKKKHKKALLLLVGDGPQKEKMEKLVKILKIKDIVFTGKKIKDVDLYFMLGDIFVLPGQGGLAINQAMAHGLPIITAPADGTEKDMVINGKNGFRVRGNNTKELIEKLTLILDNDTLRKKMGQFSQKLIKEKFNVKEMVKHIQKAIDFSINKDASV